MALKKSRLYSKLWQSCDELRGGMDARQYTPRTPDAGEILGLWTRHASAQHPPAAANDRQVDEP
ncbi:MAG: hypothetical protein AW08_00604 [Candidatus Accumulibacter adjunctus]|uniref:Uncharacterized protein n=1 Tax=Candidatus Accumulibacter adjunctus TaxID=1454001 RepID=A0A011NXL2_9PROT|nr:MAG: hypothetical protein AW08_00604 [Candidatus Accumulibacter adjunctus]